MERLATWQIALRRMEMPISRFFLTLVLPAFLVGLFAAILVIWVTGGLGEGGLFSGFAGAFLLLILPLLTGGSSI